jgi:hypothetical protein
MRFWAIEARPGELLVDDAPVDEAVSRIAGITSVEALFLFTSRLALYAFMEGFLTEEESSGSRQELEAAFELELRMAAATVVGVELRFPVFAPKSLIGVMETVSSDVRYVALDPDTPAAGVEHRTVRGFLGGEDLELAVVPVYGRPARRQSSGVAPWARPCGAP